ncbi:MAG: leucine-rich repeat protein [Monoglobaceae bacterium]
MKKNAVRKIISFLLAITVIAGVVPFTSVTRTKAASEIYSTEDFQYEIMSDNTINITKCINTTDEEITIPEEINGYPVNYISRYSTNVIFPTDNTTVKRLNISKSIIYLSVDSLKHDSLEYINVDKENTKYASDENGLLYSKNMTTLLLCPNGLQSDELIIPDSVNNYIYNSNSTSPFNLCKNIKRIVFPKNATNICYNFSNCTSLESVEFPDNVQNNNNQGIKFSNCTALKSVDLSNIHPLQVSGSAFKNCTSLEAVTLNTEIGTIMESSFYGCTSLKSIDLLNAEVTIGRYAFSGCTALSTVSGTENVTSVGTSAFSGCSSLTQISFGENLTSIGDYAFQNCTSLTEVTVPNKGIDVGKFAFNNTALVSDTSKYEDGALYLGKCLISVQPDLTSLTVKSDTLAIGNSAFFRQKNISSVELPEGLLKIGLNTFMSCTALESIVIPDTVISINEYAFCDSGIKEIVIPDSVKSLGNYCFNKSKLENITLPEKNISLGQGCFDGTALKSIILPTDLKIIPVGLLSNTSLVSFTVPDTVKNIEISAFLNCKFLETVIIPDSVTTIESSAFKSCEKLKNVSLPSGITVISGSVFSSCTALEKIDIPSNVKEIKANAFYNCTSLKEINLPDGLTQIGDSAFAGCQSLTSISIPKSVTSIGASAFNNYLKTVYFEGSEEEWNAITLGINNTPLQQAEIIFNSVGTTVPDEPDDNISWSFDSSDGHLFLSGDGDMLERDSISDYEWYGFRNRIKSVTVGENITSVASNAFTGFENLSEIIIGKDVKTIGENAFAGCTKLSLITFNGTPDTIASTAFSGCNSRMTVIGENDLGKAFAESNNFNYIPVSFDSEKKILSFGNTLTIYKDLPYVFIVDYVVKYSQSEYLHFDKLIFDGVVCETISIDNADPSADYLTLNNLYVSLKSVDGDQISFAKMLELLENGDYDAFKYVIKDDSGEQEEPPKPNEKNFFEKLSEQFDQFFSNALKTLSKVANFFRKLFK